ncbi:MAG: hydroxymethylglutaryl-CoA synthase [Spirochaetales bacterium]|nr:hydroxymethylglutaryl-CoA synthase [Spirochaetales bacterium]
MNTVGISDIALFIPQSKIDLSDIVAHRGSGNPRLERKLLKAIETTGQKSIRFPHYWEDSATIAAEAARKLFLQNPGLPAHLVRYLVAGTETTLDHSKPLASYVQGMLQKSGIDVDEHISTFQLQHACAAGTLALLSVASMLQTSAKENETGIVLSSDIARYKESTTAEITQGAGAAAVLAEQNPRLMSLDLQNIGFSSQDVDDFFRPLGQETAEVKGYYSVQCYHHALQSAFEDYALRKGTTPGDVMENTDYFVLHTPFRNMPEAGMLLLLHKYTGCTEDEAREILRVKGFYEGIDPVSDIGNIYTGSLFLTLAYLLKSQYEKIGDAIAGKRIILGSYGSGNTMAILSGTIVPGAQEVIRSWNLGHLLDRTNAASLNDYEEWIARTKNGKGPHLNDAELIPAGVYFLKSIREDGYREYSFSSET